MRLERFLEKLPDNLNKPNFVKLLKVISVTFDESTETIEKTRNWRDIDQAEGTTLEREGRNVGQYREGMTDEELRQWIKIRIRANLSGGEIETLNDVGTVLTDGRLSSVLEGWTLDEDFPIAPESASLLLTLRVDGVHFGIPFEFMKMVAGGGVSTHWQLLDAQEVKMTNGVAKEEQHFSIHANKVTVGRNYSKHKQDYHMCGTFNVGEGLIL